MEVLWYTLSQHPARPVLGQDIPLWFLALLLLGLLCASALIGRGLFQWSRSFYKK